ncbi:galactose-specific lectin nattectin-like [Clarias gariepinus]
MKVWILCALLCANFTLTPVTAAAVETKPEQEQKLPGKTTELAVEKVIEADKYNPCPSRWVKYGSRCFRLMKTIQSWLNAEAECVAQKSRLASVHNIREYNFLQSLLDIAGVTRAWIGAYHFQGVWLWFDTSEMSYTNWQSLSSVSNYTCAYMRKNAGWYNTNCKTEYSFLCAIDLKTC